MEKKRILLPSERTVTSDDVDLYLNIDLRQSFSELKKQRYDNDFDLNSNFIRERNSSRNFFIYGEIQSVAIDCDNLLIRIYSDEAMTQLYGSTFTTPIGLELKNVFGKKGGKYFINLEQYPHDVVYFKILSDRFFYQDHIWEQRVVFYDADETFVPYGSTLVDVNYEGQEVVVENDFPFFFNKHWIRNDTIIVEEKKARISFERSYYETQEATSGEVVVTLDKDSPFGIERALVSDITIGQTSNTTIGDIEFINSPISIQLPNYGTFSTSSSGRFFQSTNQPYQNKLSLFIRLNGQNESNVFRGNSFLINGSEYAGTYEILYSSALPSSFNGLYIIILDTDFNSGNNNSSTANFSSGSQPDIKFYFNGSEIQFPLELFWQEGERNKSIGFEVSEDRENELQERIRISFSEIQNLRTGQNMTTEIRLNDSTVRRNVNISLGSVYQNREVFTGRTHTDELLQVTNVDSYSILRNGLFFEGRNEEFYPIDEFEMRIKNLGQRTVFPVNTDLSILNESIFDSGEERIFNIKARYTSQSLNSILITMPTSAIANDVVYSDGSNQLKYYINGVSIETQIRGYQGLKMRLDGGNFDFYEEYSISKPFNIFFDDENRKINITAKSPGTRIDFWTNDPEVLVETISEYQYPEQIPISINLLGNVASNTTASYRIEFKKQGYSPVIIEDTNILNLYQDNTQLSLVTGYSNIMRPFIDQIGEVYTYSSSTIDNNSRYTVSDIEESQPTYMPHGNAYVNGLLFLSNTLAPNRRENLTTLSFASITEPIEPIQNTFGDIVSISTKKAIRFQIFSVPTDGQPLVFRQFSFIYGNGANDIFYRFIITDRRMEYWWTNGIGMITTDVNENTLPAASLQQRLDVGTSNDQSGPVSGELLNSSEILLSSKTQGIPFEIFNIFDTNDSIISIVLCENMLEGSENLANNRMGGFSVNL